MSPNEQELHRRGRVIRLAMLMTHYRKPIDWTEARMAEAQKLMARFNRVAVRSNDTQPSEPFMKAMLDDMNTPLAIAELNKLAKAGKGKELYAGMKLIGLTQEDQNELH